MRPRDDAVLLRGMLDYARRAITAVEHRTRNDLDQIRRRLTALQGV